MKNENITDIKNLLSNLGHCKDCEGDDMLDFHQEISRQIYNSKYKGEDKDLNATFTRVAKEISEAEKDKDKWFQEFFDILSEGKFIPGGRIMANAGTKMKYYNNCYVLDIKDSMEDIFTTLKNDALISKSGGGVGIDISPLRPKDAELSVGGSSSGAISFLDIFDSSAKVIKDGSSRRAAHIAMMDVSHPDIEEFITCKQGDTNKRLTQFNISVKITDKFIDAVKTGKNWDLVFKDKVYKTVKARELYDMLCKNSFINNEPGIFNIDTVNKYNNMFYEARIDCSNPCSEISMPANSVCCLGSINLTKFILNPFGDKPEFQFQEFEKVIPVAVRFLDDVLDRTKYPLEIIKENTIKFRRIGLGFTGLGDTLAMMKMEYGSENSIKLCEKVARSLRNTSYRTSINLAKEKGIFPGYKKDMLESKFIKKLPKDIKEDIEKYGIRHVSLNTCAPTGTISMAFGNNCSSGIEPIFAREYSRKIRTGRGEESTEENIQNYAWKLYKEYNHDIKEIPSFFKTTTEIDPYKQIDVQTTFQEFIDSSISKTLNLPTDTSFEEYKKLFMYAYDAGLKGFTTFNPEGSMKGILNTRKGDDRPVTITRHQAPKRPKDLPCDIHIATAMGEEYIIFIGLLNGKVYEIFTGKLNGFSNLTKYKKGIIRKESSGVYDLVLLDENGKEVEKIFKISEKFTSKNFNTVARLISTALRHGTPLEFLTTQLHKDDNFVSLEKAIARVIKKYITDGEIVRTSITCPSCNGKTFVFQEGCTKCIDCNWSKCD